MEIKRDYYLNKLIQHRKNGLVKIVTGVRRCGKSYLLFKLFRDHLIDSGIKDDHIISIALDDYGNKHLLDPDELYRHVKSLITDTSDYYILLDEIQLVKDFESVVNGIHAYSERRYLCDRQQLKIPLIRRCHGIPRQRRRDPRLSIEFFGILFGIRR